MRQYLKTAAVLASICAVAAILLALVDLVTSQAIAVNEAAEKVKTRKDVALSYEIGEEKIVEENTFVSSYCPLYENGKICGYILDLKGKGYGGALSVCASYEASGSVISVKLGSNSETPGVGKRYEKDGSLGMFSGKGSLEPVPANAKMLSEKDSSFVSGASVSFNGIAKAVEAGSLFVRNLNGEQ